MNATFPKVWFATDKLIKSQSRFISFSDHGSLHFEAGELLFMGRKQSLKIQNIEGIELISPTIPWVSILLSVLVLLLLFGFILSRVSSEYIIAVIFIMMPVLGIVLPFMIFAQKAI